MPSEGIELSPSGEILTNDEIIRLATLFVRSGVTKIRLTGGEPTIRKGIIDIIGTVDSSFHIIFLLTASSSGRLNELRQYGLKSIAITSNGLALHRRLPELVDKGLTHLNLR